MMSPRDIAKTNVTDAQADNGSTTDGGAVPLSHVVKSLGRQQQTWVNSAMFVKRSEPSKPDTQITELELPSLQLDLNNKTLLSLAEKRLH